MSTEMFTQLPTVPAAQLTDIICAVQGNISSQETLAQVSALFVANTILSFAGDPNGHVAGFTYQLCYDTTNNKLYVCTTTGTSITAVWMEPGAVAGLIPPVNGGTGVSNPTAHGIAIAEGSADFNFLTLTDGQLLIGDTGSDPIPATLTAGTNITITNGAGSITVASSGGAGFTWNDVTTTSASMAPDMGYIANNSGLVTLTLPSTSAVGTILGIAGNGSGGWTIAQNSGQNIQLGSASTTSGVVGSLSSTNQYDSINLVCTVADTTWVTRGGTQGVITVV